ncbi:MAG: DedA family protein [Clostridium sp.]|nr:DedA family protein [Clostridium sp.]
MQDFVIEMMNTFGYAGVFFLILIENLFPPIPSEVILTFGGFMTTYTALQVPGVIAASTAGSVLGAVFLYGAGRLIPAGTLRGLLEGKLGKSLHFETEDVDDAGSWFDRRGKSTVFFCRFVPIIRSLISIPAGMSRMALVPFLLLTAAGSLGWNTILISAGAAAGASWEKVLEVLQQYSDAAVLAAGIGGLLFSCYYFGNRRGEE